MVPSQFFLWNPRLFRGVLPGADDFLHPPLVAGGGGEHTAHQVVIPIRVGEGMQGVVAVHAEGFAGNKDGS